jgi:hypothetical protein
LDSKGTVVTVTPCWCKVREDSRSKPSRKGPKIVHCDSVKNSRSSGKATRVNCKLPEFLSHVTFYVHVMYPVELFSDADMANLNDKRKVAVSLHANGKQFVQRASISLLPDLAKGEL